MVLAVGCVDLAVGAGGGLVEASATSCAICACMLAITSDCVVIVRRRWSMPDSFSLTAAREDARWRLAVETRASSNSASSCFAFERTSRKLCMCSSCIFSLTVA